jgi:hypothetical protein
MLLTIVLSLYRHISVTNNLLEQQEREQFTVRYLEERLFYIISRASTQKGNGKIAETFYSLENSALPIGSRQPALLFCFDNGITRSKELSNNTIGLLFVDDNNALTMAYWPAKNRWDKGSVPPMSHKEILLTDVTSLQFQFFVGDENKEVESFTRIGAWKGEWKKLPHIVYIDIDYMGMNNSYGNKEKTMTKQIHLAIPVAKASPPITYKR